MSRSESERIIDDVLSRIKSSIKKDRDRRLDDLDGDYRSIERILQQHVSMHSSLQALLNAGQKN